MRDENLVFLIGIFLIFIFSIMSITYWWNVEVYKAGTERIKIVGKP